jgi:hypothetical protein
MIIVIWQKQVNQVRDNLAKSWFMLIRSEPPGTAAQGTVQDPGPFSIRAKPNVTIRSFIVVYATAATTTASPAARAESEKGRNRRCAVQDPGDFPRPVLAAPWRCGCTLALARHGRTRGG